jgi:hypothetical protein
MHFFELTIPVSAKKLPALKENLRKHGGIAVQYKRIYSLILFSLTTTHWVWVPPYRSRHAIGFEFALSSLLFGFWSFQGFLLAPGVIFNNIFGGAEVTGLVVCPPFCKEQQSQEAAIKELGRIKSRSDYFFLMMLILFFFLVIPLLIVYLPANPH